LCLNLLFLRAFIVFYCILLRFWRTNVLNDDGNQQAKACWVASAGEWQK